MTEWNIQATGKQNTSFVAGTHAALTLGSFIKNHYGEVSRWDIVNGYASGDDQGMFNSAMRIKSQAMEPTPRFIICIISRSSPATEWYSIPFAG